MADIVISHTTEDRDRAEVIARSLSAQGLKVWMYRDILGGGGDRDEVTAKIRGATRVLALWSPAGCASQWVVEEAKAAARDHRLINVELKPGMTPRAFQSGLRIDLSGWSGQRSDPALLPFAEAIATIVTGRVKGAEPERPEKKPIFGFMKDSNQGRSAARSNRNMERAQTEPSMFGAPAERSSSKPVGAAPPVPAAIQIPPPAPKPPVVVPIAAPPVAPPIVPAPKLAAPAPIAEPIAAKAPAKSESELEIQVFQTSKPRTKIEGEDEVHLSLGRAFGYGLVASVAIGLMFLAGRHYFNTRPLTIAATQIAPQAAAPAKLEGFHDETGLVKFDSELDTQTKSISSLQFGADEWLLAIGGAESGVRTYVASTGKFFQAWSGDEKAVTDVGFNSKAELLAISSVGGNITVWRLANGDKRIMNIGSGPIRALAWRPDTNYIATGSDDGLLDIRLVGGASAPVQHKFQNPITSIAWRQDGAAVAVGLKSGGVTFIDAKTGRVAYTAAGHTGAVNALAFSPDGGILGSAGDDEIVRMWSADDGKAMGEIMLDPCKPAQMTKDGKCPALDVLFSPDASLIAAGGQNAAVEAFDVKTKERAFALLGHKAPVTSIAWSYYDNHIATADRDGKAAFWISPGNH